jgi:hypothetical protein
MLNTSATHTVEIGFFDEKRADEEKFSHPECVQFYEERTAGTRRKSVLELQKKVCSLAFRFGPGRGVNIY